MVGAAVVIAFIATSFSLPIDDFWLTLASGRAILDGAPLDRALDFSWMAVVDGALNPQWGAQLVLAAPGFTAGALVINAALIAMALLFTIVRIAARERGLAAVIAALLVIAAIAPHLLARAQSFSLAIFPLALLVLERYAGRTWQPIAYGVLMAVWANLHGAFVIGQVASAAALAGAVFERRPAFIPTLTVVAAVVAPLANPVGIELIGYAYQQPGLDLIRQISVEWQPAFPWIPLTWLFWLQAILLVGFRISRRGGGPLAELVLAAALLVLAAGSIRHIPWFCLATAPLLASDLSLVFRGRAGDRLEPLPRWLTSRSLRAWLAGAAVLAVLVQPVRPLLPQGVGRVTPDAPVSLADSLEDELAGGGQARVLSEQVWGGYLAYRFGDRLETAMDGRIEIRDRSTWASYFALMRGEGDPAMELDANSVDWALLRTDRQRLITALRASDWRMVAADGQGVLLAAP